ncbi:MAG: AEC family transporter [Desulfohalobiaceae bacterium]|nr:AEC family transporter [Desulfohalobiaceae bacterium]
MLTALIPVFSIILLGYLCKRFGFLRQPFWIGAEQLTYFVLFPALLFEKLAAASFDISTALPMALSLILTILSLSLLLFLLRPVTGLSGPSFSSAFQGGVRFNTFVALAGVSALLGGSGLTLAAVLLLGMIPLINLLCVITLARFGSGQQTRIGGIFLEILRNPLILACLVGFSYNLSPLPLPRGMFLIFDILGKAALPMGLLAVGAGLRIETLKSSGRGVILSSLIKLVLFPLFTAGFCQLLQVQGEPRAVALIFSAVPTAVSAFVLARQLGGDTDLMASIVTIQTVLSVATMPLMLEVLGATV